MEFQDGKSASKQKDLFSELIHDAEEKKTLGSEKRGGSSLNLDKILLFLLTCAIVFAVVFSYGIETGKRLSEDSKESSIEEPRSTRSSVEELKAFQARKLREKNKEETVSIIPVIKTPAAGQAGATVPKPVETQPEATVPAKPREVKKQLPYFWTVQIITYVNQSFANEEIRKFEKQGYEGFVIPSGKYLQVCVGKYNDREEATKVLAKFKKQKDYADAYLRKVNRK